jgi:(p)ppGpp synthase/HD superfamily hydrolase
MVSGSAAPTDVQAPAPRRWARSERALHVDRAPSGQSSSLAESAFTFAAHCHAGQSRESDGAAFIEHPLEVARLLRDAGCSEVVVAAGLLHDVVADSHVSTAELTARFGPAVTALVQAVTDHACLGSYRQRKQVLREQVRRAGDDAALLFAANKIAKIRELPDQIRRDRARFGETARGLRARAHLERYQQVRLEHYQESLVMLQGVAPRHPLVRRLADELENFPIAIRRDAIGDRGARRSSGDPAFG